MKPMQADCATCEGEGFIIDCTDHFDPRRLYGHYQKTTRERCEDCGGSGEVWVCGQCGQQWRNDYSAIACCMEDDE